jgi:hypothetical protein
VIGIVSMTPIFFLSLFALLIWTLVVSILMYVRGGATTGAAPSAAGV